MTRTERFELLTADPTRETLHQIEFREEHPDMFEQPVDDKAHDRPEAGEGADYIIAKARMALTMADDLPDGAADEIRDCFADGRAENWTRAELAEALKEVFQEWGL